MRRIDIAESIVGQLTHIDGGIYCRCPGATNHTSLSGERDCRIYGLDHGAPTLHCMHTSCLDSIATANQQLRRAIGREESGRTMRSGSTNPQEQWTPLPHGEVIALHELLSEQAAIEAESALPVILSDYSWKFEDSAPIPTDPIAHYEAFLDLWTPDDWLWIGQPNWSGSWVDGAWGTTSQWRRRGMSLQGVLTTACTFKPGSNVSPVTPRFCT